MAAARRLAVDGDDVRITIAQGLDPGGETGLEQIGIERIDHVIQRVMRRQAALKGQEPPKKTKPLVAPKPDLDKILHAAERRAKIGRAHV